jgi:hypothetical protein
MGYIEPTCSAMPPDGNREFYNSIYNLRRIIAHFHEWMTGRILYLKDQLPQVITVFTTCNSGWPLPCGNNRPLYKDLKTYNAEEIAKG